MISVKFNSVSAAIVVSILGALSPSLTFGADHSVSPSVTAPSALVVDAASGDVLYDDASSERRQIASTTKLMTALLALDRTRLNDKIPAATYVPTAVESQLGLSPGEEMSVRDLLYALLLESANDAAMALAIHMGGSDSGFVSEMNARARSLGLDDTSYANPIGFDSPLNYSTARDLATLTRVLMRNAVFRRIVATKVHVSTTGRQPRRIVNRNALLFSHRDINGVKTGHTTLAGYCLVGGAKRHGVQLISVVLGAPSESARNSDTMRLLDYGFTRYRRFVAGRAGVAVGRVAVRYRDRSVALVPRRTVRVRVLKGTHVVRRLVAPAVVDATVRGSNVGWLSVSISGGRELTRVPLVAERSVGKAGPLTILWKRYWIPLVAGPAVAIVLLAVLVARRRTTRRPDGGISTGANDAATPRDTLYDQERY